MKHGKKSEQKSARTPEKKVGKASSSSGKKAVLAAPAKTETGSKKAAGKTSSQTSGARSVTGKNEVKAVVATNGRPVFSNPAVGAAFQRAVKKYSNAFRRLTD